MDALTVVDGSSTAPALPHEHDEHEQEAVAHALHHRLPCRILDELIEGRPRTTGQNSLSLDLVLHESHILGDVDVVRRQIAVVAEDFVRIILTVMLEQPSW